MTDSAILPEGTAQGSSLTDHIARMAAWVNENVLGAAMTLAICVLAVFFVYALIPFQGYGRWNSGAGLFFNTLSSSFELITGVAAVVAVVALHKKVNEHRSEIKALHARQAEETAALHAKIDHLLGIKAAAAGSSGPA
jgi:low affinity Fe/Cu permease